MPIDPITVGGYLIAAVLGILGLFSKRGDVWKQEAEAWQARSERLELDLEEFRSEFATYKEATEGRISRIEEENRTLKGLASGHDAVIALGEIVERNHREVITFLAAKS